MPKDTSELGLVSTSLEIVAQTGIGDVASTIPFPIMLQKVLDAMKKAAADAAAAVEALATTP